MRHPCVIVATYAALFSIAVPWHWRWLAPEVDVLWLGMPAWTALAVAMSFVISCYTAWLLAAPWPGEEKAPSRRDRKEGMEGTR